MRGLMRLLIMFGPMILRQVQRRQANKARQQHRQPYPPDRHLERGRPVRRNKRDRGEYVEYKDLNKERGIVVNEQKDFDLKEEDIMLSKEDLRHSKKDKTTQAQKQISIEEELESLQSKPLNSGKEVEKEPQEKLDLKEWFLDDEDAS